MHDSIRRPRPKFALALRASDGKSHRQVETSPAAFAGKWQFFQRVSHAEDSKGETIRYVHIYIYKCRYVSMNNDILYYCYDNTLYIHTHMYIYIYDRVLSCLFTFLELTWTWLGDGERIDYDRGNLRATDCCILFWSCYHTFTILICSPCAPRCWYTSRYITFDQHLLIPFMLWIYYLYYIDILLIFL